MVTCKSGSNQLVWTALASFAKTSIKIQPAMERPHPFLDLFLTLWPGDWREQLQQLNSIIKRDYKNKSKHKHSVPKKPSG
jgi:hypothetical protein